MISGEKKSTTSRDTRLAGRLRFYKQVGVTPTAAPWEVATNASAEVNSPISAGVDGSDSASGVQHIDTTNLSTSDNLQHMLTPRKPGTSSSSSQAVDWFGITLDGKTLKTPMGQPLSVPSQSLAYAIAAEWDAQVKYLQPANMPLMTLACTALDQAAHHPNVYREQALNFLPTDTVRKDRNEDFCVCVCRNKKVLLCDSPHLFLHFIVVVCRATEIDLFLD